MEYFVYLKCENKHTIHTMTKVLYKSYTQNDYFLFPPCIDPRMLLKIVVYAYLTNIYSGRCMASLLEENVFFMKKV